MKIVFACVENSCRSQIAEALAKKMFADSDFEFFSAGTHPAKKVDEGTISILKQTGIQWKGFPKTFADIDKPDVVVTMGCDVKCPYIPKAKMISWDIPDPKGKNQEEYEKTTLLIKRKLIDLIDTSI
ncbi:MAG: low molecular weight phosphatase family protein [bacterium]